MGGAPTFPSFSPPNGQASIAFSAVILEVYEIYRNRISLRPQKVFGNLLEDRHDSYTKCESLQEMMRDTIRQRFKQMKKSICYACVFYQ